MPPFGHTTHLRVFIDPDLLQYDEVWAAAGTWHDVFGIEPIKLVEASGGRAHRPEAQLSDRCRTGCTSDTVGLMAVPIRSFVALACVSLLAACGDEPSAGPASTGPSASSVPSSALMRIDQEVIVGQTFVVSFSGRLRGIRGGYLFVDDAGGEPAALLRSDGNSEIPMGYELDPARWGMLDDGLSGASSTFLFPPELPAGTYVLCTANSDPEECISVEVVSD